MKGYYPISRREFYAQGGFSNPYLVRRLHGSMWRYFRRGE